MAYKHLLLLYLAKRTAGLCTEYTLTGRTRVCVNYAATDIRRQ